MCLALAMLPIFFGVGIWNNREKGDGWLTALKRVFQKTEDWRPRKSENNILYQEFLAEEKKSSSSSRAESDFKNEAFAMDNPVPVRDDQQ